MGKYKSDLILYAIMSLVGMVLIAGGAFVQIKGIGGGIQVLIGIALFILGVYMGFFTFADHKRDK